MRAGADRQVVSSWVVESVEFNRPQHKQEFTLSDIGVEPGMSIMPQGLAGDRVARAIEQGRVKRPNRVWDGTKSVTVEEFREAARAGKVKVGPTIEWLRQNPGTAHPKAAQHAPRRDDGTVLSFEEALSQWERYVRDFIRRFRLNDEQTQKSDAILKACQELARQHIKRHQGDFEALETRGRELDTGGATERAALDAQRRRLLAPLHEIFEKQLKPRLEKLPTRAQRRAAERAPAIGPGYRARDAATSGGNGLRAVLA